MSDSLANTFFAVWNAAHVTYPKGLHPSEHLPDKRVKSVIFAQDHSLHLSSVFTRTPAGLLAKEIADVPGKQLGSPAM